MTRLELPEPLNKILVVNVNWLGDVVFSTPVFRSLRRNFPQAHIACLGVPRIKEVLECIPEIDEIIIYDERGRDRWLLGKCRIIAQLRQRKFDAAFLLHRSFTRAILVFLAGIPHRIGYDAKKRGMLLTHKVAPNSADIHRSDFYLRVIDSFGIPVTDKTNTLQIPVKEKSVQQSYRLQHQIPQDAFLAVIHPGANWDLKRWPQHNFSVLINRIQKELAAVVILSGGEEDVKLAEEIIRATNPAPIVLTGKTNLKELMFLMTQADVFISADSGPIHLANALGTAVVGIWGPTHPSWTSVRGTGKSIILRHDVGCNKEPCYFLQCRDNICMQAVTVDEVIYAVKQIRNP
jgi:heptosyltransferase-2